MKVVLTTICGEARTDRPAIYYVRPLLDFLSVQKDVIVWSWGYYSLLLRSVGVATQHIDPVSAATEHFGGREWLHDPSRFANPGNIEAREPLLYACWLCKIISLKRSLEMTGADAAVWIDAAYRVSYCHGHNIDDYLKSGRQTPNPSRLIDFVSERLERSPVLLAGTPIPGDFSVENAHLKPTLAGAFIALRHDARGDVWDRFRDAHRRLLDHGRVSTDEAVWALSVGDIAEIIDWKVWDMAIYG